MLLHDFVSAMRCAARGKTRRREETVESRLKNDETSGREHTVERNMQCLEAVWRRFNILYIQFRGDSLA